MSADPETESRLARFETVLEHIKDQVDRVAGLVSTVTEVQVQQRSDREAMERVTVRVATLEAAQAADRAESTSGHQRLSSEVAALRSQIRVYVGSAIGAVAGATVVWGIVAWVLKNDVVAILQSIATANGG